jgi:hypothetical protein
VNNVYRDLYGSPFHKGWVWTTRAQNAVLVNGEGQKEHSADLGGRILAAQFEEGFDYLLGDATAAYEGRLTRAYRHVYFLKPDIVVIADELTAPQPSTFQFLLHGQNEFEVDEAGQRLLVRRGKAGVAVDYMSPTPLALRQWTGYTPEPDHRYLESIQSPDIPTQWHVEASTKQPSQRSMTILILRPFRGNKAPETKPSFTAEATSLEMKIDGAVVRFTRQGPNMAEITRGGKTWRVARR